LIGVIGLHPFAFLPHTAAKTSILLLEKGRPTSDSDAIFFATSQRSGKNSVGDLVINEKGLDHDLDDLANGFIEYAVQNRLGFIEGMTPSSTSPVSYDIAVKSFSAVRPTRRIDSEFFNPRLCAAEDNLRSRSSKTIADCVESNLERWKTNGFGDIHYFDISSVDPELGTATPTCLSASEAPSRAQYVLKKGDVLVSTVRPNRNAVALITLDFEEPMVASSGFCVLRSRSIPPEYLYAYCKSELFRQILTKYSTSSMYPTVSDQDILGMPLVEPEPEVLNRVVRDVKSAFSKLGEARHLLKKSSDITNETLGSTQCEQKIMADSTRR
jgi:hypothetical protein